MNIIFNITITIASAAITTGGLYFFFKTYAVEKIKGSIKSEYDHKLESFKSDLLTNQTILSSVITAQNQGYHFSQAERISAIKVLWEKYVEIKKLLETISYYDSFILIEEFNELKNSKNEFAPEIIKALSDSPQTRFDVLKRNHESIETIRPFITDEIWIQYMFISTYIGRIVTWYTMGGSGLLTHWTSDDALLNLVKKFTDPKEYELTINKKVGSVNFLTTIVEDKMLSEISSVINGNKVAILSLEQANIIAETNYRGPRERLGDI